MENEIEVGTKSFIVEYNSTSGEEDFDFITEAKENSGKEGFKVEIGAEIEVPIPHCHVNINTGKRVCVCIYSNNYFTHNGNSGAKFTPIEKKIFDKWVHAKYLSNDPAENVEDSNWYHLKTEWETRNPDCTFPESEKVESIPNYKDMEEFVSME